MTPAALLSNALDNPILGLRDCLSNALDRRRLAVRRAPPPLRAPPDPGALESPQEGPVEPALRRFGAQKKAKEGAMTHK